MFNICHKPCREHQEPVVEGQIRPKSNFIYFIYFFGVVVQIPICGGDRTLYVTQNAPLSIWHIFRTIMVLTTFI